VAEGDGGQDVGGAYTQEQVDTLVKEKLAEVKGQHDEAFQNLWKEAKAAKAKAKAFGDMDASEVQAQLAELAALKAEDKGKQAGMTKEQVAHLRTEIKEELEKDYKPYMTQAEQLAAELRTLKLDNVVKSMMGKHGVRASRIDALYKLTADEFDLMDDGEVMLRNHPGKDVGKHIAEVLAEQFPEFYEGSGSSGGGASKSAGGVGGPRTIKKGDNAAFLANYERIISGEVTVVD
jgi:hypothetical protein